jgi:Uma2 family endonuclease
MEISIKFDREHLNYHEDSGKVYFTYDTIRQAPEWPDSPLIEIIRGDLFMVSSPSLMHQRVSLNIALILKSFVEKKKLGDVFQAPIDVVLSNDNVVVPDIVFISKGNNNALTLKNVQGVPDLVIEILSANMDRDTVQKKDVYESFKVKEYWIANPEEKNIHVCLFDDATNAFTEPSVYADSDAFSSSQFPGLSIKCQDIFK